MYLKNTLPTFFDKISVNSVLVHSNLKIKQSSLPVFNVEILYYNTVDK